ncbi:MULTISPECIES: hypothetical protein [unclassified Plantactinospora]|uniref:hypothetical protein n=1 Tax=unclassified Plantactinospora TaxID=2631981 RepID=UPI000D1526AD|nr:MULTISPECIES: hypothetical protein [unclassified Plantactinospora]AVT30455.1 hypothetical protein C6361_14225 [Plantactinospora sp. BC1]AVT36898.1 hypothetical protein C6W10_10925 [Plantactinospora sp. BB1]
MKTRRLAIAGLALVTAFGVGVAGCALPGTERRGDGNGAAAAPETSAADALAASVRKLNEDTFTVSLKMSVMSAQGAMDPKGKKANLAMKLDAPGQSMDFKIILLDADLFVKYAGLPGLPKEWMRVDAAKIKDGSTLDIMPEDDPMGVNNLMKGIVSVDRVGEREFKGTLDLAKSPTADPESLKVFGDKVHAVPFTATVDAQGRLVEIVADTMTVSPLIGDMKVSYDNFGKPVEITPPKSSEVVEMPAEMLGLMDA